MMELAMLILEFLSGIMCLYYLPFKNGYLLETQIIFQFSFAVLVINALYNRKNQSSKEV